MSLLTPPSTAHRRSKDKENRDVDSNSRVIWSESNKIHILQLAVAPRVSTATSASKRPPAKSILKKSNALLVPWTQEPQREITPEPADPLVNLAYLEYPVSTIVQATEATELKVLIEAYSVLMARLRASVTGNTDVDASWPLFQPLRKHRDAFVDAVVRDLGRALVNPAMAGKDEQEPPVRVLLPSPKNTPKRKKRDGMTAEQVKNARDLCTTCHAVIRLLSVVLTLPAVLSIFTNAQLREIFTAVLAIPLADELPTPNARKTWALAIWLIQIQRLPSKVLAPAADRISLALCRGIDGELGKEGKKGSASDGLKAIHDLSIYLPAVFIPTFTHNVLSSVLSTLLAPTLTLRTLAAHALGGFVLGATALPTSSIHTHISRIVAKFITTPAAPRPAPISLSPTKPKSPLKPTPQDPVIIRTLRTTLQATEVQHVAHGPVWGTCVLSAVLALLGPAAMEMEHAPLRSLVQLGLRHRNRSVRALTAIMWRVVIWVFLRGAEPVIGGDEEGETEADDDDEEGERRKEEKERRTRDEWWRLVASVTEFETGVCAIVATLGSVNPGVPVYEPRAKEGEAEGELELRRALEVLYAMVCKDAPTCNSAIDTMKQLVSAPSAESSVCGREVEERRSLLPRGLFSALPGLLSTEFGILKGAVNALFDETPKAEDVRVLTRKEVGKTWVWDGLVKAWRAAVGGAGRGAVPGEQGEKEKEELIRVWEGMVGLGLAAVLDSVDDVDPDSELSDREHEHDPDAVAEFTLRAVNVLINDILEDANLSLPATRAEARTPTRSSSTQQHGLDIPGFTSTPGSAFVKLSFVRDLWRVLCRVVPHAMLGVAAQKLAVSLAHNVDEYTTFAGEEEGETEAGEEINEAWAEFCVDVLAVCGADAVHAFWGINETDGGKEKGWRTCRTTSQQRAVVWRVFVRGWMEQGSAAGWEGAVCILGVPFSQSEAWAETTVGTGESWVLTIEDGKAWQELLDHTVATALDYGHDANTVLAAIAALVSDDAYMPTHIRLVEFMLTHLATIAAAGDLRELPEAVLEFAAATMIAMYPPPLLDQTTYTWAVRAVTSLVELCPRELVGVLGEKMSEAAALWIGDSEGRWDSGVLEYDILPLYQTFVIAIQGLPLSPDVLQTFGSLLCAPLTADAREEIRRFALESFREFWDATYAGIHLPEEGWGEDIETCLHAVYGLPDNRTSEKTELVVQLEPAFIPRPSTPTPTTAPTVPTTPTTSSPLFSTHYTANTMSTPPRPRPHRFSRVFERLPPIQSPESPMPASRPSVFSRPPTPWATRAQRDLPAKRRKLANGNKENLSPVQEVIPSVLERIGVLGSPKASASKVALGKRRLEEDTGDSDEERTAVESLVLPLDEDVFLVAPAKLTQVDAAKIPTLHRKRKRMMLDAVEVPLLSQVYPRLRASASFEEKPTVRTPMVLRRSMRRTKSEAKARSTWTGPSGSGLARKRRRGSWNSTDEEEPEVEEVNSIAYAPLRAPVSWPRGPYHSQSQQARLPSSELSSDDDPHIGQVTPHRLISPELKRGRGQDFSDPPSDDSVMAPSPSRDLLQRRLQRQGFLNGNVRLKPFVMEKHPPKQTESSHPTPPGIDDYILSTEAERQPDTSH
ncbi:hypothetical protein D9615_008841 [Tricholomella constricta]|uniref:Telomere-associated protein Rif1 N-terminal domain-containing protein n=1 Tax=Tricholomella constricta TaxID=117010 RepID=A0A8H5H035_9AGAR|nr:hypothetical protein D9615_008841 [Tricholomella constricta]